MSSNVHKSKLLYGAGMRHGLGKRRAAARLHGTPRTAALGQEKGLVIAITLGMKTLHVLLHTSTEAGIFSPAAILLLSAKEYSITSHTY